MRDFATMATSVHEGLVSLDVTPSQEEVLLRESVAGICSKFGPEYTHRKVEEGEPPSELWEALASAGYLGVNIPEEYGGGGLGMRALSWVGEEISAAGCALLLIVVSPAIVGSILARHGTPEQKDRWLSGIGAGTTQGRVRDHRARRRHQLAQPRDHVTRDGDATC